jgi:hypothetical protein
MGSEFDRPTRRDSRSCSPNLLLSPPANTGSHIFCTGSVIQRKRSRIRRIALAFPREDWRSRDSLFCGAGSLIIIAVALWIHHAISPTPKIWPVNNAIVALDFGPRILTALWVQYLYVFKTLVPITLSPDYSFNQIPPVMGLDDLRAWGGIVLVSGAIFSAMCWRKFRAPILAYAILFSSTANVLFPIETIMGERLVYMPSLAMALLLAILLVRSRHWKIVLLAVALVFGARTAVRNLDWLNEERFIIKRAETSPNNAFAQLVVGIVREHAGNYIGSVEAYDRAIAILPSWPIAHCRRANALRHLGRRSEAKQSYEECQRLDEYRDPPPSDVRAYIEGK